MSTLFKSTHDNSEEVCIDCGASPAEKITMRCGGRPHEEGTLAHYVEQELKQLQRRVYCICGGASLRQNLHTHYCPARNYHE